MGFLAKVPYYVSSPTDDSVLIALDPKLTERYVEWFDSVRDRMFEVVKVNEQGQVIIVETERGTFKFEPMTIELYERHIKRKVDGQPAFYSTEQVRSFYQAFPR